MNGSMDLLIAASNPLTHVIQHNLFAPETGASWPFDHITLLSNQMLMMFVAFALLLWVLPRAARMRRGGDELGQLVPTGVGNFIEVICVFLRDTVARPTLGKHTDTFVPYVWSSFFFVLTCNLLGLLPLAAFFEPPLAMIFGEHSVFTHAIGGTATGNVMVTAGLAIMTMVMIVYNGLRLHGIEYLKHFFIGPFPISLFIGFIEIIGLFAKTFALAIRLFANMVAGHLLLAVLASFIGSTILAIGTLGGLLVAIPIVLGSVAINCLELFVAFLQAFVFAFLSSVFIGQAVLIEHHDEHAHATEAEHAEPTHG